MKHPKIDGGLCPSCVTGEVEVQLTRDLIPILAICTECGHKYDPIREMKQ